MCACACARAVCWVLVRVCGCCSAVGVAHTRVMLGTCCYCTACNETSCRFFDRWCIACDRVWEPRRVFLVCMSVSAIICEIIPCDMSDDTRHRLTTLDRLYIFAQDYTFGIHSLRCGLGYFEREYSYSKLSNGTRNPYAQSKGRVNQHFSGFLAHTDRGWSVLHIRDSP